MDYQNENESTRQHSPIKSEENKHAKPKNCHEKPEAPEPILVKPKQEFSAQDSKFKLHRNDSDLRDVLSPKLGPSPFKARQALSSQFKND